MAPRFATQHNQDSFDPNPDRKQTFKEVGSLTISEAVEQDVRKQLAQRGHNVEAKTGPIGTPVMLLVDQGTYYAAGDPAAGRHAAGLAD
jgi:gamma-glutamyltranspeptidase